MRFPGFEGEWESKKLSEIAEIGRGKSKHRPRDAEFLFGGKYPFVQTGDIRKADLFLTQFTQTYSEAGLMQSKLWNENTLCITIAANIAETAILKIKACFPDSIIGLIPKKNETTVLFVKHLFDKFKIEIQRLSQGVAQDNLNQEKLSKIEFSFPKLVEQDKVTSFLSSIDERIATQNKIIEQLQTLIKGLCQEIILSQTPNRKLKDCVSCYSSSLTELDVIGEKGTYPVYGATGIITFISKYQINEDAILIIKDGSGVGKVHYATDKFSVTGTLNYLIVKPAISLKYIFYCLKFFNFKKYKVGSSIPHIYFKDYGKSFIYCPSFDEQQKIEMLLSSIDEKINIESILLKKYEMQKKHLLQNLFI